LIKKNWFTKLEEKRVVLFVGRINPDKGLEHLIKAADIVVNQHNYRNVLFLLVGPFENVEFNKPGTYTEKLKKNDKVL